MQLRDSYRKDKDRANAKDRRPAPVNQKTSIIELDNRWRTERKERGEEGVVVLAIRRL